MRDSQVPQSQFKPPIRLWFKNAGSTPVARNDAAAHHCAILDTGYTQIHPDTARYTRRAHKVLDTGQQQDRTESGLGRIDFKHIGADDCCKQLIVWRPLIVALRKHYYGR